VTAATHPARSDRWLRAVGYGFLAELMTVLTIIAIVQSWLYFSTPDPSVSEYAAFGLRAGKTVGIIGGTLYTYIFARLMMPLLTTRFVAHGAIVALSAIAFSIAGSIAGHNGVPGAYLLASALKLGAGVMAGALYARGLGRNQNVV
jgi:hypothetical protein